MEYKIVGLTMVCVFLLITLLSYAVLTSNVYRRYLIRTNVLNAAETAYGLGSMSKDLPALKGYTMVISHSWVPLLVFTDWVWLFREGQEIDTSMTIGKGDEPHDILVTVGEVF